MKKADTAKAGSKRRPKIQMCCDRILTGTEKITAMKLAFKENSKNRPPEHKPSRRRFGASSMGAPLKMALESGKKWADGKALGVYFMDGSATQKARVKEQAIKWSKFANITFDFNASKAAAHIRSHSSPTTARGLHRDRLPWHRQNETNHELWLVEGRSRRRRI
jgi:hypothetical protein